ADLSAEQAAFMAQSQVLNFADNFKAVITTAAWRSKPSWALVAAADRTINPDLERWYATRANSHKVEVAGASHAVYVSRPKEVAALIEEAASHARQKNLGKKGLKNMNFNFLQKQTSRRGMLRDSVTLALLSHLFPATLLRASAADDA